MKKKILLLLLVLCIVGCGKKKEEKEFTNNIIKTKNEVLIETINSYITSAVYEVNSGNYGIYDSNALYLIPAGDNKYSCLTSEMSSYGNWRYLYIGVEYSDYGYNYYAIGEDENGRGIDLAESSTIKEKGKDIVYSSSRIAKDGYDILYELYNSKKDNMIYKPIDQTSEYSKLSKVLPITKNDYKNVVIVGSKKCEI